MVNWSQPALLLLVLSLPWLWWSARRANRPVPAGALMWRTAIATLMILAAAGPGVATGDGRLAIMYVADRSGSVGPRAQADQLGRINTWSATMRGGDTAGLIVFGADPVLESGFKERLRVAQVTSGVSAGHTNIASALQAARAALPSDAARRLVLLSDGRENTGDALGEAAIAGAAHVPIDVVLPADRNRARVVVSRVSAPDDVRVKETFAVTVEFAGRPGGRARLAVSRDGQPFASQEIVVPAQGTGTVSFLDAHLDSGLHDYAAIARDELDDAGEDRVDAPGKVVSVEGVPRILYVTESQPTIVVPLTNAGFRVDLTSPPSVAASANELSDYDAVVLDDVRAERFEAQQLSALAEYVTNVGGGLLLLGSPRNLDAGGYPVSPVGGILPIDLRPRTGRKAPGMAFALVFDKSGSMADLAGGVPKIELARQSVMRVLDVVPSSDPLGVIAFDQSPVTIAPLSSSREASAIASRLRDLRPGGSTLIAPAVELAIGWLKSVPDLTRRHILLLSDGRDPAEDAARLRRAVAGQNVQVSVVALGADADRAMLGELARSTGGRAYFPDDLRELPRIVAREAARAAGGTVVEEPFVLRLGQHPVVDGISHDAVPRLGGYVVSAAQQGAQVILQSHLDDPVLAVGNAGLGKVGIYTADLGSTWSSGLRGWRDAPALWAQTARWIARRVNDRGLRFEIQERQAGPRARLQAWNPDSTFAAGLTVTAEITSASRERQAVTLQQIAPGEYEADLPVSAPGTYAIAVVARGTDGRERRLLRGLHWWPSAEISDGSGDAAKLARIAELSGGRVLGPEDSPFAGTRAPEMTPIRSWLALAALLMFIGELVRPAFRRWRGSGGFHRGTRHDDHGEQAA